MEVSWGLDISFLFFPPEFHGYGKFIVLYVRLHHTYLDFLHSFHLHIRCIRHVFNSIQSNKKNAHILFKSSTLFLLLKHARSLNPLGIFIQPFPSPTLSYPYFTTR